MKTAVIGVGVMGSNHARALSEISDLVGVYDTDKFRSKEISKKFNAQSFKDIDEITSSDIEAVSICAPTALHYELAKTLITNGKNVLVEKPFCGNIDQAQELIDLAHDNDVTLAVGLIERFNPIIALAKSSMDHGEFGKTITISSRRVSAFPPRVKDVGVIIDLAIHDIDIFRYITGSEISEIHTVGGGSGHGTFEDHANMLVTMDRGITGFIEVNWLTPMKVRNLVLTCSNRYIEIDYMTQSLSMSSSKMLSLDTGDMFHTPFENDIRNIQLKKQEPLKNELLDFINAIKEKKQPLITGEDAIRSLKCTLAANESLRTKKPIQLEW